jgi:hypothetical protein
VTWLTEDITYVLVIGALVLAALAVVFMKTGRASVLVGIAGVALLMVACALVEHFVVTQREQVDATLEEVRQAFVAGDQAAVMRHIAPGAAGLRRRATWVLDTVDVVEAKITDGPRIEINELTSPPSAVAELIAVARGRLKVGSTPRDQYAARFTVTLSYEDERWRIENVEEDMPFGRQ